MKINKKNSWKRIDCYKHTSAHCKYSLRANSGEGTHESASIVWTNDENNNECAAEYGEIAWIHSYYVSKAGRARLLLINQDSPTTSS